MTSLAIFATRSGKARNYMRDSMKIGDEVLFYHSSCPEPGIAGIARVASPAYPDESQFRKGKYFDAKATRETPRWFNVDVQLVKKTPLLSLQALRDDPRLASMLILKRGNRLSITPVTAAEWKQVMKKLQA